MVNTAAVVGVCCPPLPAAEGGHGQHQGGPGPARHTPGHPARPRHSQGRRGQGHTVHRQNTEISAQAHLQPHRYTVLSIAAFYNSKVCQYRKV